MRAKMILAAVTFVLMSCGNNADGNFCALVDGNFLRDPGFTQRAPAGALLYWASSQHAGEISFDLEFDDGEVTISKIGTQPWLIFRQTLAASELAGKKVALTAELRLDLQPPVQLQALTAGGGLKIVARSSDASGRKLLLRSIFDHQPSLGKTDWFPVQVVVQLPKKTGTVEVGFLHQADGTLQVRNPSFQLVDESVKRCKVSPNAIRGVSRGSSGLR